MNNIKNKIMELKKEIAIVISFAFLFWFGFGETQATITQCKSTVTKYVTAEFSELVTGIDLEGNVYTEIDTWSDNASLKFIVESIDGYFESSNYEFKITENNGYFSPPMPTHDNTMKNMSNFDRFSYHNDSNLNVSTYSEDGRDSFNEPVRYSSSCTSKLQTEITVKEWYFISYGSDWNS